MRAVIVNVKHELSMVVKSVTTMYSKIPLIQFTHSLFHY